MGGGDKDVVEKVTEKNRLPPRSGGRRHTGGRLQLQLPAGFRKEHDTAPVPTPVTLTGADWSPDSRVVTVERFLGYRHMGTSLKYSEESIHIVGQEGSRYRNERYICRLNALNEGALIVVPPDADGFVGEDADL